MPQITVGEETFRRLSEQARSQGFTDLPAYLDDLAEDDFVMTPEIEAALEEGLEDLRQGRVASLEKVREDRARLKTEWLAQQA